MASSSQAGENSFLVSLQNHSFVDSDQDGYTNGIFLSRVRFASQREQQVEPAMLLAPLSSWLGLPAPTLAATTLEQIMITPRDLERRNPAPNDTPYAGLLELRSTDVYAHGNVADMLALNVGLLGPASGAEQVQKLIHRLNGATTPRGWHTQGPTRALLGVEAYRAWRVPLNGQDGGFDAAALLGSAFSNRESSLGSTVLVRWGSNLARSFPSLARVVGRTGDPFVIGAGWFAFAGFSADRLLGDRWIGNDAQGNTAEPRKSQVDPMLGFSYGWGRSSLSISIHSATPLVKSSNDRQKFGSITYIWAID